MFRGSIRGGGGRVWNIKSGGNIYIVCQRAITAVPRQERPPPAQPRPSTSWRLITELGWDGGLFARLVFAKCRECRDVHHKQTEPIPKSSISSVSFLCWAWQKLFHGLALYLSLVLAKCFCIVVTSLLSRSHSLYFLVFGTDVYIVWSVYPIVIVLIIIIYKKMKTSQHILYNLQH